MAWKRRKQAQHNAPDIAHVLSSAHQLAAEGVSVDPAPWLAWPGDVRLPLMVQFEALETLGTATVHRWTEERRVTLATDLIRTTGERTIKQAELDDHERLRAELDRQSASGLNVAAATAPPIVGEFLAWVVTAAALGADYTVLRRVFQNIDINEDVVSAQLLGFAVSLLLMLGGLVIGRALRTRFTPTAQRLAPPPVGPREIPERAGSKITAGAGPSLAALEDVVNRTSTRLVVSLAVLLTSLAAAVGWMRATIVNPSDDAQSVLGLGPRAIAGIAFTLIQLAALLVAIAVAYFAFQARTTRNDGSKSTKNLGKTIRDVRRAITHLEHVEAQLQESIDHLVVLESGFASEVTAAVAVERQRVLAAWAAALGSPAYHILDAAGPSS